MSGFFQAPSQLDIVYGRFPYPQALNVRASQPHYCLVLDVLVDEANGEPWFFVAVGTSKNTTTLLSGEFLVQPESKSSSSETSGLGVLTKFSLQCHKIAKLPYNDIWFEVPPSRRSIEQSTPKIGTLNLLKYQRALTAAGTAVGTAQTLAELASLDAGLLP